jgi:hypothetical protein
MIEKRKEERFKINIPLGITVKDLDGRFFVGSTLNIGVDGMAFIVNTFIPPNNIIIINFELEDGVKFDGIKGRVLRCKEHGEKFLVAFSTMYDDEKQRNIIKEYLQVMVFLKKVVLFKRLEDEELWFIKKISKVMIFKDNDLVFKEAVAGDIFYIVIEGKIAIKKNQFIGSK